MLNLQTGVIQGQLTGEKRLRDLAPLFGDQEAVRAMDPDTVLYRTYGCPSIDTEGEPELLYATTVLYPGDLGGEFFFTRGHFHTNPLRGEVCLTLSGKGELVLMDRDRNSHTEAMSPGAISNIDGRYAHRVVNTGEEPLVFFVTWLSDCGHDYDSILADGFSKRIVKEG